MISSSIRLEADQWEMIMHSGVTPKHIFQLKITLNDIDPPIWRRIQVPDSHTFWDLHVAIQNAMGWSDTHLHEFLVTDPASGTPVRIGVAESKHHPSSGGDVPVGRVSPAEENGSGGGRGVRSVTDA